MDQKDVFVWTDMRTQPPTEFGYYIIRPKGEVEASQYTVENISTEIELKEMNEWYEGLFLKMGPEWDGAEWTGPFHIQEQPCEIVEFLTYLKDIASTAGCLCPCCHPKLANWIDNLLARHRIAPNDEKDHGQNS